MAALDLNYRGKIKTIAELSRPDTTVHSSGTNNGSNDGPITVAPPTKLRGSNDQMLAVKDESESDDNTNNNEGAQPSGDNEVAGVR